MPELPEVESIRRYLVASEIEDTTITRVEVGWSDSIVIPRGDTETFTSKVLDHRIVALYRRGKYLIASLSGGNEETSYLVLHMGMTGSLHVRKSGDSSVRYRRAAFFLDDGRHIELNDYRRWAKLWGVADPTLAFPRLASEPWGMTSNEFAERLRARGSRIKPALLDQSVIAGIGNIYADESLHRAGISPMRRCNRISTKRLVGLHVSIIAVLEHAIAFISRFPSEDGSPYVVDAYDERMRVQRSSQSACPDCEQSVVSKRISGRTTYYCRVCQR